jgi:RNA polymerase sigma factor (sigma-70 family)
MGETFEELIGRHLDDLYSAALCFTLDEHRAEELLQEASVRAFHELSDRSAAEFRMKMIQVLVSTFLQRQRRMGRDPLASGAEPVDEMLQGEPPVLEPFPEPGTPGYRLIRDWLSRAWAELEAGDRLILWLADVERLRHTVIAAVIGLDVEEVRRRHYRARLSLSRGAARELGRSAAGGAVS